MLHASLDMVQLSQSAVRRNPSCASVVLNYHKYTTDSVPGCDCKAPCCMAVTAKLHTTNNKKHVVLLPSVLPREGATSVAATCSSNAALLDCTAGCRPESTRTCATHKTRTHYLWKSPIRGQSSLAACSAAHLDKQIYFERILGVLNSA